MQQIALADNALIVFATPATHQILRFAWVAMPIMNFSAIILVSVILLSALNFSSITPYVTVVEMLSLIALHALTRGLLLLPLILLPFCASLATTLQDISSIQVIPAHCVRLLIALLVPVCPPAAPAKLDSE